MIKFFKHVPPPLAVLAMAFGMITQKTAIILVGIVVICTNQIPACMWLFTLMLTW